MNSFFNNRLIKLISPISDDVFTLELGGNENELRDLIATILNISPSSVKGIRDSYGNYYTLSSAINNTHLTSDYSSFYFIVLKDTSPNSKISTSSSQITNIYNNYSDSSPKGKKENFSMNNKKDPNEQIAFKLFNAKLIDENKFNVLRQLIVEQNDEILELFKLYINHGKDLKKLAIQINPILDDIYESDENSQKKPSSMNYNNYIDSIKDLINKNDMVILNKLMQENNEQIFEALDDYSINNNKEKLLTNLNTIINVYRERFEKPKKNPSMKKEEKMIKKSEKIQKKLLKKSFISDLSEDIISLLKYDLSSFNPKQKIELFNNSFHIKDSSSINSETKEYIKEYYNNKLHTKLFKNFNETELEVYDQLIEENNEYIINIYKEFEKKKNIDELISEIRKIIDKYIQEKEQEEEEEESEEESENESSENENDSSDFDDDNSDNSSSKKSSNKPSEGKKNDDDMFKLNLINNANDNKNKSSLKKNDDDDNDKKIESKISNIVIPGVSQKKINEFIKVINGMAFNEDEKNNILNLLSTNNDKIMAIFNKFQKNKLSLTKKVLLNLLSETKKKSNFKKNTSKDKIQPIQDSNSFESFIKKMLDNNKLDNKVYHFLLKEYKEKNEMLCSFWEVYLNDVDDVEGLEENIEIFIEKFQKKINEFQINDDNNNNGNSNQLNNLLNTILQKGNFNNNEKKVALDLFNNNNNVIMSILEVYDPDDEEDTVDSIKTLISKYIRNK